MKKQLPAKRKTAKNQIALHDPRQFEIALKTEAEKRKLIQSYIKKQLIEGVDYGPIVIGGQKSKPTLFKPGAEKFCSLLHLRPRFEKDSETLEMLPESILNTGVIALKCELIHEDTGKIIAEGRGACTVQERKGQLNTAIKIAEKRAQLDAVLRIGLSDTFTQDLEDMQEVKQTNGKNELNEMKIEINNLVKKHKLILTTKQKSTLSGNNFNDVFSLVQEVNRELIIRQNKSRLSKEEKEIREIINSAKQKLNYTDKQLSQFCQGVYPGKKHYDDLTIEEKKNISHKLTDLAIACEQTEGK